MVIHRYCMDRVARHVRFGCGFLKQLAALPAHGIEHHASAGLQHLFYALQHGFQPAAMASYEDGIGAFEG